MSYVTRHQAWKQLGLLDLALADLDGSLALEDDYANGRQFARRVMDDRWGKGNWENVPKRQQEYNELKKYGDRAFRDPRSILSLDNDRI